MNLQQYRIKYKSSLYFSLTLHLWILLAGMISAQWWHKRQIAIEIVASCEIEKTPPKKTQENEKPTDEVAAKVRNTVGGGKKKPIDNIMDSGQGDKFDKNATWINKQEVDKFSAEKFERVLQKIRDGSRTLETDAPVKRSKRKKIFSVGKRSEAKSDNMSVLASMIFEQVYKHWIIPAALKDVEKYVVVLSFEMCEDGSVSALKVVNARESDQTFMVIADSAKRAVISSVPFKLPVGFCRQVLKLQFNCAEALKS